MDMRLLLATVGMFVGLVVVCLLPVSADSAEDGGDGRSVVVIPRHVKTPAYRPRTWMFLIVTAGLGLVFLVLWTGTFVTGIFFLPHTPNP